MKRVGELARFDREAKEKVFVSSFKEAYLNLSSLVSVQRLMTASRSGARL